VIKWVASHGQRAGLSRSDKLRPSGCGDSWEIDRKDSEKEITMSIDKDGQNQLSTQDKVELRDSGAAVIRGQNVDIREGGAMMITGENIHIREGGAALIIGKKISVQEGGGGVLLAEHASLKDGTVIFLGAKEVSGDALWTCVWAGGWLG
jgi:hypothetical protein